MSFRSPYPDVEVPDQPLFDYLFGDLGEAAEHPALIEGSTGATTSYSALKQRIESLASGLAARGFGAGEVVGMLCPNVPAFTTVFHGILRAGGTATTINSLATVYEIAAQLADAKASHLFTLSAFLPQADEAANSVGLAEENVVVIDGSDTVAPDRTSLASLFGDGPAPDTVIDPASQLAVLPYSSGTTGKAKGVMLTHRNLVANLEQSIELIGVEASDRVLCVLPFFHIYGMNVLMNGGLRQRATLITMPKFDLAEFLRIIADHQASFVFIAPPVAVALAKHPLVDAYDLSSLRVIFSGAAPLDGALAQAVEARLGCTVRQGYGMTEMSPVSHCIPLQRADIPLGTVGLTIPNMECKLVDAQSGEEIAVPESGTSRQGELWCKGPNVMRGYFGDARSTGEILDQDGFLHTGDVATVSAEGYLTVVDRVKELIKYKGYQVPPAELEALLLTHPDIADAAVIGVRDADGEEIPKAFVVPQPAAKLRADDVMAFVTDRVAPYKKVRQVEFVTAIPKSASGKILRRELRRTIAPSST
jgi:acyl-CoA synthetase (AMP-forming)/AMP-acid ligase II